MWSNVLESDESSFTKTMSKSLWHDANIARHANSLLNASNAKCPNRQQERLIDTVSEITASISWMPTRDKSLSETSGQKLLFPSWSYFQTSSTQQERNLNSRMVSMSIFPGDLEQVYDIMTEHKLPQTGLEEATAKLIKDWLE